MGDMYVRGYQFMPAGGYQQTPQVPPDTWQPAQAQVQGGMAGAVPPPLPAEVPPPLPADVMQPAVMQQADQQGMQAWGQGAVQQPQQGWDQQQAPGMAQQQWQPQQMQQWQPQEQQQQQWQAQVPQQTWQGQEQWQAQQQPQQLQQQWQQPPPQPKASGKGDWRELWRQQLQQQQQQQQQQWGQGMGMQQWGQGMGSQQPYGGVYNQQQYNYGQQQPQQGMMQQGAMYNQYGQQQQMQQQTQQLPGMPPNPQQAWGGSMYQQPQGPMSQQGAYAAGPQHMQQQGPGAPSPQALGAAAGGDYSMGGMGAPGLQQQPLPQPAAPVRPPSPPKPLDLSQMLLAPGRDSRPKRLLLLLRGPPGCGKSHVARTIRQMEVSAGGQAPRVHSIDDYFMVDVEQDGDEGAGSKRRGSAAVTAQEYQYDAALEPSYWKSLLRAAGKTLGDGLHPMVLLDAPALKAEQVREVWKVVQGAGAELLVVNPLTTDPEVCFKQNVHKHNLEFITAQAKLYETVPATFTCADASLLYEDKKKPVRDSSPNQQSPVDTAAAAASASISEVDMAVDEDSGVAAAAGVDADAAGPGSTEPATSLGTPSSQPRPKSSRWEDDSDAEDTDRDPHAAATGSRSSPEGQHAVGSSTAADRPMKKARLAEGLALDAFDAESLLAGVNQELELLDAAEGSAGKAAAAAAAAATAATAGTPGAAGRAGSGPLGVGGGNSSSSSGGRLGGILKKHGTPNSRCKKVRVRWPDLSDQAAQPGFRIAAPVKPLAEVYWVEGLGPSKELWMAEADLAAGSAADIDGVDDAHHGPAAAGAAGTHVRNTFADQVRAEHRAEHDLFRAILLGQPNTPAGPPTTHKAEAAGSVAAGSDQSRLFMQRKS